MHGFVSVEGPHLNVRFCKVINCLVVLNLFRVIYWVHKPCLRNRITFGLGGECRVTGANTVAPDTGNCAAARIGLVPYALCLGAIELIAGLVCSIINHTLMLARLQNTKRFRNI